MWPSLGGLLLGLVVGLRHAFEPDHLAAVSTLVAESASARKGALLGAIWGLGHTISLVVVGVALLALGAAMPARLGVALELGVALMLIGLGVRALHRAVRDGGRGPFHHHHHAGTGHSHAAPAAHFHLGRWVLAWRPLGIGLVHGLAGSGALTALVFAELPSNGARILYMVLFGAGSVVGMAMASGIAGASLHAVSRSRRSRRILGLASGALSIGVGLLWGLPLLGALG
jgi:ABC-type nickel/cobalt efflux system permease component RcnA